MLRRSVTRRQVLKWASVAATSGVLLGCGSPVTPAPAEQGPTPVAATSVPQPAEPTPVAGKVTVVWSFWGTSDPAFIESQRKLAAPFMEAHPDITVDPVPTSQDYDTKVLTMLAGGSPLDALKVNSEVLSSYVAQGTLRPLDEFLNKDTFKLDSFYPHTMRNNCQIIGGKLYGLPNGESAHVVYFNAKMFKDAGLPDPRDLQAEGKWTQEVFLEAAKTLTKGEGANKVFGTSVHLDDSSSVLQWMHTNGGRYFDSEFTECTINKPEAVEAIQRLADLIKAKIAPSAQDTEAIGDDSSALAAQRLAMEPDWGIWETVTLKNIKDFEWDAVAFPKGSVDANTAYNPHGYTVPVASKVPDAAWEFNKFITGPEVEKSFIVAGSFECKHPANEQFFLENAPVKNAKLFIDWIKEGHVFTPPYNPRFPEMRQLVASSLELVVSGEKTVQEALDAAKVEMDKLLKEVREKWPQAIPVIE